MVLVVGAVADDKDVGPGHPGPEHFVVALGQEAPHVLTVQPQVVLLHLPVGQEQFEFGRQGRFNPLATLQVGGDGDGIPQVHHDQLLSGGAVTGTVGHHSLSRSFR